jgi:hypothetical protein
MSYELDNICVCSLGEQRKIGLFDRKGAGENDFAATFGSESMPSLYLDVLDAKQIQLIPGTHACYKVN